MISTLRWMPSCSSRAMAIPGMLRVALPGHADPAVLEQPAVRELAQAAVELGGQDQDVGLAALDNLLEAFGQGVNPDRNPGRLGVKGGEEVPQQDERDVVTADSGEGARV